MFRFLKTLLAMVLRTVVDAVTGLVRIVIEQLTHRDFTAETAEQAQAEASARDAAAREAVVEARHEELVAVVEQLTKQLPAKAEPVAKPKSIAERRKEIADQSRSHDPVIRSSTWSTEPEVDGPAVKLRFA